ncbi:hypothetical protein [Actinoplanes sp. NPDC051851]|uniref:hypothetical protein n=1 Tax=Actinoplanes sp. NPDC051851 TaxID=3154753 RepID=UPI00341D697B
MLLEGPAIEPLLAQVRDEYGSRVRIISADKVRSGGIGGFFAKQHYELSVEVPDPSEDSEDMAQQTVAPSTTNTLERLLEQAESQDRFTGEPPGPDPRARAHSREAGAGDTGAAFAELMAGLDVAGHLGETTGRPHRPAARPAEFRRVEPTSPPPTGRPTSPAPTGRPTSPAPTGRLTPPAPAGRIAEPIRGDDAQSVRPFHPASASEAPVNRGLPAAPGRPKPPPAAPVSPAAARPAPGAPLRPAEPAPAPSRAAARPTVAPIRSAAEAYGLDEQSAPVSPAPVSPAAAAPPAPAPAPPAPAPKPAPPRVAVVKAGDLDPVQRNLITVGMPEEMARQITGGDTYAGVLSVLAARPAAPGIPDGPGEILVIAGEVHTAVPIAKSLLEQIRVDQTHLLLAGPSTAGTGLHSSRLISSRSAAESRADKLQSADQPTIVVIDAPVGGTDPFWVNDMCDALGATALWAVVDATRKTADSTRHLRNLGDVEALVVHSVELTSDPASVLGLDVPIFSLDGKPATPHAWAAMLCARIAAEVMPAASSPRRAGRSSRR